MVVDQRRVQIDRVRHHRRAQHRRGREHRVGGREPWHQSLRDRGRIRRVDQQAGHETERDNQQQTDDDPFEQSMRAPALESQQQRGDRADDATSDEQRQSEQQVQRNRPADQFGQIGGDGDDLGLGEEQESPRVAHPLSEQLRQRFAGDDAEFGGLVLDEDRHHVRQRQHPHQQIAVPGSRRDVRRHIAWIHIRDGRHECRAEHADEGTSGRGHRRTLRRGSGVHRHHLHDLSYLRQVNMNRRDGWVRGADDRTASRSIGNAGNPRRAGRGCSLCVKPVVSEVTRRRGHAGMIP